VRAAETQLSDARARAAAGAILLAGGLGALALLPKAEVWLTLPPQVQLTVVDPMVAVAIGIVVLGEASQAPLWAMFVFAIAGTIAIWGVFLLARNHPQTRL